MRSDLFDSLPRPTALLLLSAILGTTYAHVLQPAPRQAQAATTTVPYRVLNVVSWPLRPTPPPRDLFALRRQQDEENTVCGYIGGDSALPATCGSGSHCALDTEHNVVGCCPNGADACTAGVFTGCVDANSGPQTEVNPYVYSCSGGAVCYKNIFDGGFSQFGCGTASDQATSVMASASGMTSPLTRPTISISLTQSVTTLSEPTTLGTITSSASSLSKSLSTIASSSTDLAGAAASSSAASPGTNSSYRTGAIIGGTIGGVAVLIALIALAFFFLRRRKANLRQGPGPGGARGKHISAPMGGSGSGFAALAQESDDAFETGPITSPLNQNPVMTTATDQPPMIAGANIAPSPPANRGMLPPLSTHPPMPFQSEVSPVADDPDLDQDRSPFAYGGISSASVSSYPPSSTLPPSSSDGGANSSGAASTFLYPNQFPAAFAPSGAGSGMGAAGVGMGMVMMGRAGHRERADSDQIPLTREIDDFSHGFHAALGRIGEEDEEEEEQQAAPYRDHDYGRPATAAAATTSPTTGAAAAAAAAATATAAGGGDTAGAGQGLAGGDDVVRPATAHDSAGSGRPLWQQNRRQSRNLMWM